MTARRSPLHELHVAAGARLAEFGGWDMPLQYATGTLAEHMACRERAALFDVSHLGTLRIEGPGAFDRIQNVLTNDLNRISPGRAQYSHLCDAGDGSVLDDVIVWWVSPERFDVVPNASNTERVARALEGADVTAERAVVALQGPDARRQLARVSGAAAEVGRFEVREVAVGGAACVVAGTGYTGEDGVEIAVPIGAAAALWEALVAQGAVPAGLGARDTLRLEAGMPLHGHELGPGITPLQAGLGWVVAWDKPQFWGRDALLAERERGIARRLRGLVVEGRRPPRAGQAVLVDGRAGGEITSGNFSPVLQRGIALGFLPPEVAVGTPVEIDVRGSLVAAEVTALPFVARPG